MPAAVCRSFAFAFRLQHRLRHFLDEQRNAVCALDNVLSNTLRAVASLPATPSIIAAISRSPSRLRVSAVT